MYLKLINSMTVRTTSNKVEAIKEIIENVMNPIGEVEVHTINGKSMIFFKTLKEGFQVMALFRKEKLEPRSTTWNDDWINI